MGTGGIQRFKVGKLVKNRFNALLEIVHQRELTLGEGAVPHKDHGAKQGAFVVKRNNYINIFLLPAGYPKRKWVMPAVQI